MLLKFILRYHEDSMFHAMLCMYDSYDVRKRTFTMKRHDWFKSGINKYAILFQRCPNSSTQ